MKINPKLKEKANRNNKDFPFYVYKICAKEGENVFLPHWHTEFEIILADCTGIAKLDTLCINFRAGDVLFVNKEVLHSIEALSEGSVTAIVFDFKFLDFNSNDICQKEIMENLKSKALVFPQIIYNTDKCYDKVYSNIHDMVILTGSEIQGKELKIKTLLYDLIFSFYSENRFIESSNIFLSKNEHTQVEYVKLAQSFMESNFDEQITLSDIAGYVNISKFYLIKLFKQYLDFTPSQYLKIIRLESSKELLIAGKSVSEVAMMSGFNNISYYVRAFKEQYKITPNDYKKNERRKYGK